MLAVRGGALGDPNLGKGGGRGLTGSGCAVPQHSVTRLNSASDIVGHCLPAPQRSYPGAPGTPPLGSASRVSALAHSLEQGAGPSYPFPAWGTYRHPRRVRRSGVEPLGALGRKNRSGACQTPRIQMGAMTQVRARDPAELWHPPPGPAQSTAPGATSHQNPSARAVRRRRQLKCDGAGTQPSSARAPRSAWVSAPVPPPPARPRTDRAGQGELGDGGWGWGSALRSALPAFRAASRLDFWGRRQDLDGTPRMGAPTFSNRRVPGNAKGRRWAAGAPGTPEE